MLSWFSIGLGLLLMTIGADVLVRGASAIARRFGLSELFIGLTLVGFGTSTPELVSSIEAARIGAAGVALGNVVGSNIVNVLLIIGIATLIAPIAVDPRAFRRDALVLAIATIAAVGIAMTGSFGRAAGGLFIAALAAYIAFALFNERVHANAPEALRHEQEAAAFARGNANIHLAFGLSVIGLILLIVGAKLLVNGAVDIATKLEISDAIIGLTVVAIGTSLPELVTSITAAMRGKSGLAMGNIVGSNIYNILGILGLTALVAPFEVSPRIQQIDIWIMLAATALVIFFARTDHHVKRWEGAVLAALFLVYISSMIASA
ncbi:MAG: calcium/sodium antiporter [Marinicaulis sp.]|nr:calcium/sodium antiporter [Marinicaulis sp.]NNE39780.1 calcium/sodium antiporter [Marinicaulis sp.]NNL88813.1 calcium/sodium antiporter [Marinicaulis sp.]